MKSSRLDRPRVIGTAVCDAEGLKIGRVAGLTESGGILVDFHGNPGAPVEARTIAGLPAEAAREAAPDLPVLLFFEDGDPSLPIVLGFIHEAGRPQEEDRAPQALGDRTLSVRLDGKRLVLDAQEEIVLRCGRSSVTLRADGKLTLKGADLISRSSGTNRIRGASVKIN